MRIPARFAPLVFGALLSSIMVGIVSAFVLLTTHGLQDEFWGHWLKSFLMTWPIAFPAVTLLAPWVRRVVDRLTA